MNTSLSDYWVLQQSGLYVLCHFLFFLCVCLVLSLILCLVLGLLVFLVLGLFVCAYEYFCVMYAFIHCTGSFVF